jgi:hypothetical protein
MPYEFSALQGISNDAKASVKDVAAITEQVKQRKSGGEFVMSPIRAWCSASPTRPRASAACSTRRSSELIDLTRHNIHTLASALRSAAAERGIGSS